MARSIKQQIKKQQERNLTKLKHYLETMAAAYAKHCNIIPDEVVLRSDTVSDALGRPAGLKYWYEHHGPRVNDQSSHPHVQYLFDISFALVEANKKDDQAAIKEGLQALADFMTMYEDKKPEASENDGNQDPIDETQEK